jgi:DNA polymerase-1
MLFTVLNTEKPDAIVVCWDAHAPTLRSQEFEAYKAHRPETAPELKQQMPVAREMVAAFGILSAELDGYEADDLIGTLARKGEEQGYEVGIFTGDSDQLQLVTDHVHVLMTQRGVTEIKIYTPAEVVERYGIEPNTVPDWKALVGDTSDNIPGVPGIGEKTATALLQQWHSLENLIENVASVTPPKAKAALEANTEQAHFSKRLATIECAAPLELEITPYKPSVAQWSALRDMFLDLEFRSLIRRIPLSEEELQTPETENLFTAFAPRIERISSAESLQMALEATLQAGKVALVPSADGSAMQGTLNGIAFASSTEVAYYVPIQMPKTSPALIGGLFDMEEQEAEEEAYSATLEALTPLFTTPAIAKIGHNTKYLEILLERAGLPVPPFTFDTEIAGYILHAGRSAFPLSDLASDYLGVQIEDVPSPTPEQRAKNAALITALQPLMQQRLAELEMTAIMERIDMPLVSVLATIERAGILIDNAYLSILSERMARESEAIAQEIYALAGEVFNIGSPKQLQVILFEKMKLPTGRKIKTGYSTGAELLEQLAGEFEIARKILDYREITKLKSTYADALPRLLNPQTGRVHTSLNQTVASTGRLSSSDPNLQNIPIRSEVGREIRRAFVAPKGRLLLSCDYSQIELRLLAHIAQDPTLVAAFSADADIHAATAAQVFNVPLEEVTSDQRRQAKTINFAVLYGQGGFSLAQTLGVDTATANVWIAEYFERLPGVKRYIEETKAHAHAHKYVKTLHGRRRYFTELDSSNFQVRQFAERAAVNMPIQGTAADVMKLAMIAVINWLEAEPVEGCTMVLQVHDELLFEVDEEKMEEMVPLIVGFMEGVAPEVSVRLKTEAKVGKNWADMKPVGR